MGLENDIFTAVWNNIRGHRTSTLNYISRTGWFKHNFNNIPAASLPAVCVYPVMAGPSDLRDRGDAFLLSLQVKGIIQHFDPQEGPEGVTGRKGILDLYTDLDGIICTMITQAEVTVDTVTTTTRTFPVFTDIPAVRDIRISPGIFSSDDAEYPNQTVTIPFEVWYIKTDVVRRIS